MPTGPLNRMTVRMDGFPGAPGFMTFYGSVASTLQPAVKAFCQTLVLYMPGDVTLSVPADGDIIDPTTGNLTGAWSSGSAATYTGSGTDPYVAPAGACVSWITNSLATGASGRTRRLRGRTFLVPLRGDAYQGDGSIAPTSLAGLRTAASTLWVDAELAIWRRPTSSAASDGFWSDVTGSDIKDRAAILRSRRA